MTVCACVCVCVCIYAYKQSVTNICMCVYVCVCVYVRMYVCVCICVCMCVYGGSCAIVVLCYCAIVVFCAIETRKVTVHLFVQCVCVTQTDRCPNSRIDTAPVLLRVQFTIQSEANECKLVFLRFVLFLLLNCV